VVENGASSRDTAVLLVVCPDQAGIVAAVSAFLYEHGANIVDSDQHTDYEAGIFFMRVEWERAGFRLGAAELDSRFAALAHRYRMQWQVRLSVEPLRMGILVSKYDHCLYDLLIRHAAGELRAAIPLVISNHPDLEPVARHFGVPFHVVPVTPESKPEAERLQLALLAEARVDFVVLARYMQILGADFVASYRNRIINIHHSFLPAFVGASPHRQAFARGVKLIGATAHYITENLDDGPIIEQSVTRVSHRDRVEDLVRLGRDQEKLALAHAVRMHLEHRILCYGNKTVVFE
jgi:formyltetrahydrofolate deformylase